MVDQNPLVHGKTYDAAKAHEYYLRTRQLKGRRAAAGDHSSERPKDSTVSKGPQNNKAATAKEMRAIKEKRLADLNKRLDRLQALLRERVAQAKKRSGIKDTKTSDKSPSTKKSGGGGAKEHLSAKEKRDAAERAKKSYEKNKPQSLDSQIEAVQKQIQDVREKLKAAAQDARKRDSSKTKQSDGTDKARRHQKEGDSQNGRR